MLAYDPGPQGLSELNSLKFQLLQAESRLLKAKEAVISAELDIRILNNRIAALPAPEKSDDERKS